MGRPEKYRISHLEIGECETFTVPILAPGEQLAAAHEVYRISAAVRLRWRSGKSYRTDVHLTQAGFVVTVTRVADACPYARLMKGKS